MAVRRGATAAVMPRGGASHKDVLTLQQSCQGVVLLREVTWTTWLTMAVRSKATPTFLPRDGASKRGAVGRAAVRRTEAAMAAETTTGSARKSKWGFRCSRCGCGNSINVLAVALEDRRGGGEEAEREGRGKKISGHPEATTPATTAIAVVARHI
ncbi:unnamed protein product [Closterium sp. Naga37s-1]|nr:unnamed protein product [Closterium sp. Naga37s-1]